MQRVFQVRRPYWDHVKVKKKNRQSENKFFKNREREGE